MNYKKLIFISILLLVLSVAAVSAGDLDNNHTIESCADDSFGESMEIQCFENTNAEGDYSSPGTLSISENSSQIMQDTVWSFSYFQQIVDNAPDGSTIYLSNDVIYDEENELNDAEGIIINKNLVIDGRGHVFDGKSMSGILQSEEGSITLKNIIFKNGYQESADDGGAIRILDDAKYTIINCTFDSNHAYQDGGAIYNDGEELEIIDSTFVNNRAEGANRLNDCEGGAIHSKAHLIINHCVFENNCAGNNGGAIYASGGLTLVNTPSYFRGNSIINKGDGGAIYTNKINGDVKYAVFTNNQAPKFYDQCFSGGAIYIDDEVHITFENCYFAYNQASYRGGAIYLDDLASEISLINNIFLGNTAPNEYNSHMKPNSVYICGEYVTVENNWWGDDLMAFDDVLAEWHAVGPDENHFDEDSLRAKLKIGSTNTCVNSSIPVEISFVSYFDGTASPKLFGLDNFVFSSNHLGEFSNYTYTANGLKAIYTPKENGIHSITLDNAFNEDKNVYVSLNVSADSSGPDNRSQVILNTALSFTHFQNMVNNAPDGSVVYLSNDFIYSGGDCVLNDKDGIIINKDITIDGQNHTFDAKSVSRIFQSSQGNIIIKNIIFRNGEADEGAAIFIDDDACYTIYDCEFINNNVDDDGAAIKNEGGYLKVVGSTFIDNRVAWPSGSENSGGAIYSEALLYIENCFFRGNFADDNGGAICAKGGLEIANVPSYFESNHAGSRGGAIYATKFIGDVKYATFISNLAGSVVGSYDGGAVYVDDEVHVTFEKCVFVKNHCTDEGGAIYLDDADSELSLINNIFIDNSADDEGQTVFNCGKYVTVEHNWWGDDLPMFDDVLVEWHSGKSNEYHYDVDSLKAFLTLDGTNVGVNSSIRVHISLFSAFDDSFHPVLGGLENFVFESDHLGVFSDYEYGPEGFDAVYTPKELGIHKISIKNLFNPGREVVGYINVGNYSGCDGEIQRIFNNDLSLTHFQRTVNEAPNSFIIYLNRNYAYYGGDCVLNDKEGVVINKDIVIDGCGHSFDARSMSGIFQSSAGHVTLRNIVFKNGNQVSADDGGAVRILGDARYTIVDCVFDSNHALQDGGAIYNEGGKLEIWDSTFTGNSAEGANKLNDCDGGAIHSKNYTYLDECVFMNNFAADNGGAVYVTGNLQLANWNPSYFESNTANKGKGGAIYTNAFTTSVKYASFINNRAGDGAIISDDGGAVYINNKNEVTFDSCLFANNHCTDEGGAIYMDDGGSKLSLINNIFVGNVADDEGQAVFTCGNYGTVTNNFWAGNNPSKENDQLIGWMPIISNWHQVDDNPLSMGLVLDKVDCAVNTTFEGNVHFYNSNGVLFDGELTGLKSVTLSASPKIDAMSKNQDKNTVYGTFTPDKEGKYVIIADLFGHAVSKSINVFEIDISADEVTTFTNVPVTFKVHLDGDKKFTANQKVRVSFFKDYDVVTDENGDAVVTFDDNLNLDVGRYRVDISSNGFAAESAVNVITTIFAEDVVQVRGDQVTFKAQFTNNSGNFLKKSTQVQFLLDGSSCYSVIKDNNGNALADFYSVSRGEHKVVVVNPDNGESKTYRIVILMGFGETYDNGSDSQNQEPRNNAPVNADSLAGDLFYDYSVFSGDDVVGVDGVSDNGNATNSSANSPVSKVIDSPQTNGGDNNLWWIILAILAVIAAGGIIKKYKS